MVSWPELISAPLATGRAELTNTAAPMGPAGPWVPWGRRGCAELIRAAEPRGSEDMAAGEDAAGRPGSAGGATTGSGAAPAWRAVARGRPARARAGAGGASAAENFVRGRRAGG